MKIIHTADWQLGKPFGRFEPDIRAALTEARFDAIDAIGRVAAAHSAGHVVVAGDLFDTEGPEDRSVVQALSRMERFSCRWWLLPGNHDFARNGGSPRTVGQGAPQHHYVNLPTADPRGVR